MPRIQKHILILLQIFSCFYTATWANFDLEGFPDWKFTDNKNQLCHGYYIEPIYPFPLKQKNKEAPTILESNKVDFFSQGRSLLSGNVSLNNGNINLLAKQIQVWRDEEIKKIIKLEAKENVLYTEPGIRLAADYFAFNYATDTKYLENVRYRLYEYHARGNATAIKIKDSNKIYFTDADYTSCGPEHNTWKLKAKSISIDKNINRGYVKHAHLLFKGIPIFYLPYFNFPIDNKRKSGLLLPTVRITTNSGIELSLPLYINLAPNYDLTIKPRFLSKRGIDLQGEFRYISHHYNNYFYWSILPSDNTYNKFKSTKITNHGELTANDPRVQALRIGGSTRYALRFNHHGNISPNWNWDINYQKVSDDNYFVDLGNTIGSAGTTNLPRELTINYNDSNISFLGRLQHYQTLQPFDGPINSESYWRLPQLYLKTSALKIIDNLYFSSEGEFSYFYNKRNILRRNPQTIGYRSYLRPGLFYEWRTPGAFLVPRLQFDIVAYNLSPSNINLSCRSKRYTPIFDIDSGLIFNRILKIQNNYYKQTLEPRLYFVYIPFREQSRLPIFDSQFLPFDQNQLFRINRFSGVDRLGDTKQITISLASKILSNNTGEEIFKAAISQVYYLHKQVVTACNPVLGKTCPRVEFLNVKSSSNFVTNLKYQPNNYLHQIINFELNPNSLSIGNFSFIHNFASDKWNAYSLGYYYLRYVPEDINSNLNQELLALHQFELSAANSLHLHWRLLSHLNYDLKFRQINNLLLGVEYQGCCISLRVGLQRFLHLGRDNTQRHYSNGYFFEFIFKGFTKFGDSSITNMLEQSIPGYKWTDNSY